MSLYKSDFQEIFFHPDSSTLENVWSLETKLMTDEEFKQEMLELSRFFLTYRPEFQLINTQDLLFVISPELQSWSDENILKPHGKVSSLRKVAFVVSKDLFPSVAVEQTMDEEHGNGFNTRFFKEKEEAIKWLTSAL